MHATISLSPSLTLSLSRLLFLSRCEKLLNVFKCEKIKVENWLHWLPANSQQQLLWHFHSWTPWHNLQLLHAPHFFPYLTLLSPSLSVS